MKVELDKDRKISLIQLYLTAKSLRFKVSKIDSAKKAMNEARGGSVSAQNVNSKLKWSILFRKSCVSTKERLLTIV